MSELTQSNIRDGIPIQKGAALTEQWLEEHVDLVEKYSNYFLLYPDAFLDIVKSSKCPIEFFYYQRIFLRAAMRYRYQFGTFTRGTSKSFLAILSQLLACIFLPGSRRFLVSEFKSASLAITRQKLDEIYAYFPIIKYEIFDEKKSTDYIEITFKNGSFFQILGLTAASRGQRANGGVAEEAALIN